MPIIHRPVARPPRTYAAYFCDETNDYWADSSYTGGFSYPYSLSLWCRMYHGWDTQNAAMLALTSGDVGAVGFILGAGYGWAFLMNNGGWYTIDANDVVAENTLEGAGLGAIWHLAVVVASNTDRRLYVNGYFAGQETTSVTAPSGQDYLTIGCRYRNVAEWNMYGWIWNVGWWDVALQEGEVRRLADPTLPVILHRPDDLHAAWFINRNDGTDESGNGINLSAVGNPQRTTIQIPGRPAPPVLHAARTIRYANFDLATGNNDGTSEANAWQSWSAMQSGLVGGEHVYIKRTSSRHGVLSYETISKSGTNAAPLLFEGYSSRPGDGGDSGIDNFAWFTMYRWTVSGHNVRFKYLDLEGNSIQPMFEGAGRHTMIERCKVWSANGSAALVNKAEVTILNCWLQHTNAGGGPSFLVNAAIGQVLNCFIETANTGNAGGILRGLLGASSCACFSGNIIVGSGTSNSNVAIYFSGSEGSSPDDKRLVMDNSIYNVNVGIFLASFGTGAFGTQRGSICNNIIYNCNKGIDSNEATTDSIHAIELWGNAIGGAGTARYENLGDAPTLIQDITLTANPWTAPGSDDYSLNSTAGGGAAAKDVGIPTDTDMDGTDENGLDIGAVQGGS